MYSRRINLAEDRMDTLGREKTGGIRDSAARVEGRAKKKGATGYSRGTGTQGVNTKGMIETLL